jgi:hypothetical protein
LVIVAVVIAGVIVVFLGIGHVRRDARGTGTVESPVVFESELESEMDLLRKIDYAADRQYARASGPGEGVSQKDYSQAERSSGDYVKGKEGLEKISLGEKEDLYVTEEGELWYVSEKVKMQVQVDETTGQMDVINVYDRSQGSKELERISMSDSEDLYITGEGELWYVRGKSKMQAYIDEATGEMVLLNTKDAGK